MELKSWGRKLCICDRVRGNQPYVSRNIFPVFAGYRKYNALSRAVQNLSDNRSCSSGALSAEKVWLRKAIAS